MVQYFVNWATGLHKRAPDNICMFSYQVLFWRIWFNVKEGPLSNKSQQLQMNQHDALHRACHDVHKG